MRIMSSNCIMKIFKQFNKICIYKILKMFFHAISQSELIPVDLVEGKQ